MTTHGQAFEPDKHPLAVVVAAPMHSSMAAVLSYAWTQPVAAGTLVRVPLGAREVLGVAWHAEDAGLVPSTGPVGAAPVMLRAVASVFEGLPPLALAWRQLVEFTAHYYQRTLGEVALAALPPQLRELSGKQLERRLKPPVSSKKASPPGNLPLPEAAASAPPVLTDEQAAAIAAFHADSRPALLFGITGSGKTEVYLRLAADALAANPQAQVLVLVPEINLTPQLVQRFAARFAHLGASSMVTLHSGLTPAQRLGSWLAAHTGQARLVLGTRMAVLASLPHVRLIVVDEEHDPSYKQQEGARYSARDLAVLRAKLETEALVQLGSQERCRVLLGSATPSLESWQATLAGRYQCLKLVSRTGAATLPLVRRVDMRDQPRACSIAPPLLAAMIQRIERGEQVLVFLNRRGYAPVLACHECGWKSDCPHCSAYRVFHKIDRTLRCHHCGASSRVPRACPQCGNIDIAPMGRGTEQIEEQLAHLLADVRRPDGQPVRIARIDADSTRSKGALEQQLQRVHAGDTDVLVGTQMVAKGHDFRHITLVAAINPDGALFSSDFRAPERLFSLLMQAAGRAGRDAMHSEASEMWVQTYHPAHPLFAALKAHDYPAFAHGELVERKAAGLAPFGFMALLRAEARTQEVAQAFLNEVASAAESQELPRWQDVTRYPAVPMSIQRVANIERAQLLVESHSRRALQEFLTAWQPVLLHTRKQAEFKTLVRWAIDVDPVAI